MFKIISTLLLLSSAAKAEYIGFASGFNFQATPIEGTVVMTCEGFNGNSQATYTCRDVVLDPANSDIFMGPQDVRAKQLEIRAEREDGTSRVKMSPYDGKNGKSISQINLWISTLFQKPLLATGMNHLYFSLYDNSGGSLVEYARGEFLLEVKRGAPRHCPTTQYSSTDVTDCNSQYSVCQRYFEQFNNCR